MDAGSLDGLEASPSDHDSDEAVDNAEINAASEHSAGEKSLILTDLDIATISAAPKPLQAPEPRVRSEVPSLADSARFTLMVALILTFPLIFALVILVVLL